jgi:hypothetical protein
MDGVRKLFPGRFQFNLFSWTIQLILLGNSSYFARQNKLFWSAKQLVFPMGIFAPGGKRREPRKLTLTSPLAD